MWDLLKKKKPEKKKTSKETSQKKKEKNKNSDTKNIDPGNPKKIRLFTSVIRNSLGHRKFIPLTSVNNLVLNLRAIASTNKNEFVESNA